MPGTLFYLLGASGSGKDSIIQAIAQHPELAGLISVAKRRITRPCRAGDDSHIALGEAQFQQQLDAGQFVFAWQAHGHHYGIPKHCLAPLQQGKHVLINGSRAYLTQARQLRPDLQAVLIHASPATLQQRLHARQRESTVEIHQRLRRATQFEQSLPPDTPVINNNHELGTAVDQLAELIRGQYTK